MFLSRVILNPQKRETLKLLASPGRIHGAIECSLKGERMRNLWRVDQVGSDLVLLVLSEETPDFSGMIETYGNNDNLDSIKVKDYSSLLKRVESGQRWQFRLTANPIKNIPVNPESGKSRGKVVAHVTPDQQKEWLLDRSEELGFLLKTDQFDVVSTFWKKFKKSGQNQVTLKFATFEGILEIKDAEIFRKTLLQGIGRGKAYGCGLLTIVKV